MDTKKKTVSLHADVNAPPEETVKYSTATLHPVQKIEREAFAGERMTRRKLKAAIYGAALPMRTMMHEHMLSQCHRLGGLPSSFAGLESYTGRDETIDFEDFLNVQHESPDAPREEARETHEKILHIKSASTL